MATRQPDQNVVEAEKVSALTPFLGESRMLLWLLMRFTTSAASGLLQLRLSFESKRIRQLCEKNADAVARFGNEIAEYLHDALAELRAAPSISDIASWSTRMECSEDGLISLHFAGLLKLAFVINQQKLPYDSQGRLAWEKASSIKIIALDD